MVKLNTLFAEYFDRYDKYRSTLFMKNDMALLSARQLHYLSAIKRLKNPTFSDLAEHFLISRPAVTKNIDKLEKLGYVVRVNSKDDKRFFKVILTKTGKEVSKLNFMAGEFIASEVEGRLDKDEISMLKRLLEKGRKK